MDLNAIYFGFYLWFQLTNVIELPFDFAIWQKGFEFLLLKIEHKSLYNLINSRQEIDIHSNYECDVISFNAQKETNWKSSNE